MPIGIDSLAVIIVALFLLATVGAIFGPALLSRYEDWKIKKGLKG
jgi:hypothetical protein